MNETRSGGAFSFPLVWYPISHFTVYLSDPGPGHGFPTRASMFGLRGEEKREAKLCVIKATNRVNKHFKAQEGVSVMTKQKACNKRDTQNWTFTHLLLTAVSMEALVTFSNTPYHSGVSQREKSINLVEAKRWPRTPAYKRDNRHVITSKSRRRGSALCLELHG